MYCLSLTTMIRILENVTLENRNSFGIPARTRYWIEYDDPKLLPELLREEDFKSLPKLFVGSGTNLLFVRDFPGIMIHSLDKGLTVLDESRDEILVQAGPGMIWDDLVKWAVDMSYYGIENLSLIPGTVGAAVVQNIGAYGSEFGNRVFEVDVMDINSGETAAISRDDCQFSYRHSIFKEPDNQSLLITGIRFVLSKIPKFDLSYGDLEERIRASGDPGLELVRQVIVSTRQSKLPDPDTLGNAGSFFKNPVISTAEFNSIKLAHPGTPFFTTEDPGLVKIPAAWMIEKAGWKGYRSSSAGVYHKQALVLVNHGGARGGDILKLAIEIQKSVYRLFGISLEPEVRIIGIE